MCGKYIYDAWGNHNVQDNSGINLGIVNPIRYRGYYYDTESGLYYLNSRYYDPEIGRFISQDSIEYLEPERVNGLNLWAYCGSNPVMRTDRNGTSWLGDAWNWVKGAATDAWNWTTGAVTSAGNWIAGAASTAWNATSTFFSNNWE